MKLSTFFRRHRWCQGAAARDACGFPVWSSSPNACQWCLMGAAVFLNAPKRATMKLDKTARKLGFTGFIAWQDKPGRTKREVIELLVKLGL